MRRIHHFLPSGRAGALARLGAAAMLSIGLWTNAAVASLRPSQPPSLLTRDQARGRIQDRHHDMQLRRERHSERRLDAPRRAGQSGAPRLPAVPRNPVAVPAPGTLH